MDTKSYVQRAPIDVTLGLTLEKKAGRLPLQLSEI